MRPAAAASTAARISGGELAAPGRASQWPAPVLRTSSRWKGPGSASMTSPSMSLPRVWHRISHVPSGNGGIPEVAEREQIQRVFACLPQDYAVVLKLSVVQGFPYQEIAAITGLSPSAAATRLSRAKGMFVEQYQRLRADDIERQEDRP